MLNERLVPVDLGGAHLRTAPCTLDGAIHKQEQTTLGVASTAPLDPFDSVPIVRAALKDEVELLGAEALGSAEVGIA